MADANTAAPANATAVAPPSVHSNLTSVNLICELPSSDIPNKNITGFEASMYVTHGMQRLGPYTPGNRVNGSGTPSMMRYIHRFRPKLAGTESRPAW